MTSAAAEKKDTSFAFAKSVASVRYEDLPSEVVEVTKTDILDTIGVAIAGSSDISIKRLLDLIREWGGKEESTILVFGDKVPSISAALVNANMAHVLEFDDVYGRGMQYVGMSTVPPAFAIAERKGKVNGKDLITAIALGQDMALRMYVTMQISPGLMCFAINGFGATATAGKLLELNEEQMADAFGIAYSQYSGNSQCIPDGAMTKGLTAGLTAKTGVLSALLAQKGYTGKGGTFEGTSGFCNVYCSRRCDLEQLTANLGKHFEGINLGFKPYPCGISMHPSVTCAIALVKEHNISPNDIEEIKIGINSKAHSLLCKPIELKTKPRTVIDAQFSAPYIVVTAIVDGKVDLSHFTEEAIKRPEILQLLQRVKAEVDPDIDRESPRFPPLPSPSHLRIKTKDGKVYEKRVDIAKGNPKNPMTRQELRDKFYYCAGYSARPLAKDRLDKVVELVDKLEEVDDVSQVIQLAS